MSENNEFNEEMPELQELKESLGDISELGDFEGMPSAAEIQSEFEGLISKKFGGKVKVMAQQMHPGLGPLPQMGGMQPATNLKEKKKVDLNFEYRPKDIKKFLDKYVIKQDEAKKALSIAVCDHYNHVRHCAAMTQEQIDELDDNYAKQNVLMLGPTGVGKTYLIRTIAKLIGVPFVKADATRFTEMGYMGANVDDMVRDLVTKAEGDLDLAQYGIIYLDEVDKLAGQGSKDGKDVSGRGVQVGLLKLMEETEIDLRGGNDVASQMQVFMDFQKDGKINKKIVNSKHILFIVSGSFSGMDEIIRRRLKTRTIGLNPTGTNREVEEDIFGQAMTKDFIDFGFEPEFIGRLPVRLSCQILSSEDLLKVLKESKGSILKQYKTAFKAYGIDIDFTHNALVRIAELAHHENTGARGLMTVCERIFRDFKFELPSTDIKQLTVSKQLVDNPKKTLEELLKG